MVLEKEASKTAWNRFFGRLSDWMNPIKLDVLIILSTES